MSTYTYVGAHRMHRGEQRVTERLAALRRHETPTLVAISLWWAAVVDWARIPWSNMGITFRRLTTPRKPVGGYQICLTCQHNQHAGCGLFDTDPPCGCRCYNATKGRHDHEVSAR